MKLTTDRTALHKALAAVSRIVPRRTTIPILGNVRLDADGDRLVITGTNLDIEARLSLPAAVARPGTTTVPAATLADIAGKLPAGAEVSLALTEQAGRLSVTAGRSRFSLPTLPPEDFPDMQAGDLPHAFTLAPAAATAALGHVSFAISTEETRYYLNGVHLHPLPHDGREGSPHRLRAVATDGHRLALTEIACGEPVAVAAMPGIIVPRATCAEIDRLARTAEQPLAVAVSATKIRITAGGGDGEVVLTSKLIDGTYPDYQRVVPAGNDRHATLDRDAFAGAVSRVATVASERGKAVKVTATRDLVALSVVNPDAGSAEEEIEADYAAEPLEIGFNARYLADLLGVFDGDRIRVAFDTKGSPTLFRPLDPADPRLVVLMPMRV